MSKRTEPWCIETLPGKFALHRLAAIQPTDYPYFLESSAVSTPTDSETARYDILFGFPQATLSKHPDGQINWCERPTQDSGFLTALDRVWQSDRINNSAHIDVPFSGGWFLYLSYELVAEIEPSLRLPRAQSYLPIAQATRIPAAAIYDHQTDKTTLLAEPGYGHIFERLRRDVLHIGVEQAAEPLSAVAPIVLDEEPGAAYCQAVERVLEYIRAGDVFQVNLSRCWQTHTRDNATRADWIYAALRRANPAPFSGMATFSDAMIASSSPERLVRVVGDRIETRPIAGTKPRGVDDSTDQQQRRELLAHPKERAEHIMLIDLERNDLGRICLPGSVYVDQLMDLESYAHVHHIVSNIRGRLQPAITPGEIIRAVFPGGTITGCPKVRCMEIIAELENAARGPYTGSFGYLNHSGALDLNILIRTIVKEHDRIWLRTGAGLVADSIPQRELEETRAKAKGMLLALQGKP